MNFEKMESAFALVTPNLRGAHWKDAVEATVSASQLEEAGVSLEDVEQSVIFFTATVPTLDEVEEGLWSVTADGYRMGPAGDF